MPIFEYACDSCGTKFEKLVRRSTDDIECPKCTGKHLTQQLSTFSAHANSSPKASQSMPSCGGGMCGMPGGMCGRN